VKACVSTVQSVLTNVIMLSFPCTKLAVPVPAMNLVDFSVIKFDGQEELFHEAREII
jgi:hypothetical protein